ncbi:MAG TPA: recombinase [Lachnospiraceae bacterium]|nr:recombinase [Lachnospiraceae bacterium]
MSADLQTRKPKFSVAITTEGYQKLIRSAIPDAKSAKRFMSSIMSAVAVNPTLQECDPSTILSAALLGESLGLTPSPQLGQYYLVPFNNRKKNTKDAQFQLGYKGYVQLAIRSRQYSDLGVSTIHEGEYKGIDKFTGNPIIEFIEDDYIKLKAPVVGYHAYFVLENGFRKSMYWSKEKMEQHADRYSQAFSLIMHKKLHKGEIPEKDLWKYSSFWYKNFDAMAEKTMLRQLLSHWGVLSVDMVQAFEADNSTVTMQDGVFTTEQEDVQEQVLEENEDNFEDYAASGFEESVNLNDL